MDIKYDRIYLSIQFKKVDFVDRKNGFQTIHTYIYRGPSSNFAYHTYFIDASAHLATKLISREEIR